MVWPTRCGQVGHQPNGHGFLDIFYDFLAEKLTDDDLDDVISDFFSEHQTLALKVQRQAEQCERYTQYLKKKKNGLYETEVDKLLAVSKALKVKWDWS